MKDSITLVGYLPKRLDSIELLPYHFKPDLIPDSLKHCDLWVKISRYSEKRSLGQNDLLFGYAYPIIIRFIKELTGEDRSKDYIHVHNMTEIQGYEYKARPLFGKNIYELERPSSAEFSRSEFSQAYEKLQDWWAEKGCIIPDKLTIFDLEVEELFDESPMPFGPFKGKPMIRVPEKYLKELYNDDMRYCSEAVRKYIIDTKLNK